MSVTAARAPAAGFGLSEAVLNALPHPVITVAPDGRIARRQCRRRILLRSRRPGAAPPPHPRVRALRQPVARAHRPGARAGRTGERVSRRSRHAAHGGERIVDMHVAPMPEQPGHVVIVLQERTMADKIDRQLTHRGAARSVIGARLDAGARDQEPAVGHSRRGATARAGRRRRRPRADAAHLRRGRPHREARRPHGGVLRRAADGARSGQHPRGARAREAARGLRVCPQGAHRRGVRSVAAAGLRQPRPAGAGLPQPREERRRGDGRRGRRRDPAHHGVPAGRPARGARARRRA